MRRLLFICLLLALPLQGPWAAIDGGCCRGQPCPETWAALVMADIAADTAAGADEPVHSASVHDGTDQVQPCDGATADRGTDRATLCDAGCPHCQGSGAAALPAVPVAPGVAPGEHHPPAAVVSLPDPLPEHLLRPPRTPRA